MRRRIFYQPAIEHNGNVVGYALGLRYVVSNGHYGVIPLHAQQHILYERRSLDVKRRAGFVQQKYLRLNGERPCYSQPLLLPAGKLERVFAKLVLHLVIQAHYSELFFNGPVHIGFGGCPIIF